MAAQHLKRVEKGSPLLLGTNRIGNGFQFAIEAPETAEVSLLLYYKKSEKPVQEIVLGEEFSFGRIRSVYLAGFHTRDYEYNYKINGVVVQDPYAYLLTGKEEFGKLPEKEDEHKVRCGFLKGNFSWEEDQSPSISYSQMVLYKVHVRGFTKQAGIPAKKRGTFSGIIHMIPYLKKLGINALELMPAYEFTEIAKEEKPSGMVITKKKKNRVNYWGYMDACYTAPKSAYSATDDPEKEFKTLIRELHKAGIECIMELYFPAEINPLIVLRVAQFWHLQYHVDGFHMTGDGVVKNLLLADPILSNTKIMVDGFPEADLYKTSNTNLAEYNDGFLQDMRRFLKGDEEVLKPAIWRIRRNPEKRAVINYLAYQNGFTLMDLFSFNLKHNEDNGEDNQDGQNYNFSWNCGNEGPVTRGKVRKLREKILRNAIVLLFLSQGTPMLYGGDEFGNSQNGNNNAYCQDNPIGWIDWKAYGKNRTLYQFVKQMIEFRVAHPIFHGEKELRGVDYQTFGFPDISFHGERAWFVDQEHSSRLLGIMYNGAYAVKENGEKDDCFYIACNFQSETRSIAIPNLPGKKKWYKILDTNEVSFAEEHTLCEEKMMEIKPYTIVILTDKEEE